MRTKTGTRCHSTVALESAQIITTNHDKTVVTSKALLICNQTLSKQDNTQNEENGKTTIHSTCMHKLITRDASDPAVKSLI